MAEHAAATRRWTTRELLQWITGYLRDRGIDSPRVCAELLLAHVIGCERMRLYMEVDRPASTEELERLRGLVARGARHEPIQYLVGHAWFFTHRFAVDESTLIPRPSTETLVERIIAHCRPAPAEPDMTMASGDDGSLEAPGPHGEDTGSPVAVAHDTVRPAPAHGTPGSAPSAPLRLLDIGTGTGCIAISAARALGHLSVVAVDIEPRAIDLASRNAIDLGVAGRIDFRTGDLFSSLDESDRGTFDVIASNPPYISDAEWSDVAPNVRDFEPERALRGGADGLDVIRRLLREAPQWLRSGGLLAIEIAASLGNAAQALASAQPELFDVQIARDHEGLDRVLLARRR